MLLSAFFHQKARFLRVFRCSPPTSGAPRAIVLAIAAYIRARRASRIDPAHVRVRAESRALGHQGPARSVRSPCQFIITMIGAAFTSASVLRRKRFPSGDTTNCDREFD